MVLCGRITRDACMIDDFDAGHTELVHQLICLHSERETLDSTRWKAILLASAAWRLDMTLTAGSASLIQVELG
ncbi:hypothetical protein PoB_003293300 [Plakobranchus ocellatus]|uniref:Uncharacterized protein n=1 Tax=Plakobranchus ocellatus TaxID=259542 RepID=A0AAV4AGM6_9GAST|nr:hypothetical protein PoB_003293300 [Plakobranchus ocellatus]